MMTMTAKHTTETAIAAAVVKHLEAQGLKVRQEVYVTLPDHGMVPADIVACKVDPDGEYFTVVECKRRLDKELEEQANRWIGFTHNRFIAYMQPKVEREEYDRRVKRLVLGGSGRLVLCDDGDLRFRESSVFSPNADTRLISAAFHSHSGELDPAAGSAAAHRITGDRATLCDIAALIGDSEYAEISNIKAVPKYRKMTGHKLRNLIDANRDWMKLPLDYRGHARTQFYVTGAKAK